MLNWAKYTGPGGRSLALALLRDGVRVTSGSRIGGTSPAYAYCETVRRANHSTPGAGHASQGASGMIMTGAIGVVVGVFFVARARR